MSERTYEVRRRPVRRQFTNIPQEIVDHYEGLGYVVTLASADPNVVTMLGTMGRHPILADEDEMDESVLRAAKRAGFHIEPDGTLKKPDCLLYKQPASAQQYWREEAMMEFAMQDDPEHVFEQMEEWNQKLEAAAREQGRGSAYSRMDPSHSKVSPASDHGINPSILREEFEQGHRERGQQ